MDTVKRNKEIVNAMAIKADQGKDYWFNLYVGDESIMKEWAEEDGLTIDWDKANDYISEIELNVLGALKSYGKVTNEGHGSNGELGGDIYGVTDKRFIEITEDSIDTQEPLRTTSGSLTDVIPEEVLYKNIPNDYSRIITIDLEFGKDEVVESSINKKAGNEPGKFEGEPEYVEYFWEFVMDGYSDGTLSTAVDGEGGETYDFFRISDEDRQKFPELKDVYGIAVWSTQTGFIEHELLNTEDEYNEAIQDLEKQVENIPQDNGMIETEASMNAADLDGAQYIKHDPETELVFVWHGGLTVNIYSNESGKEVDVFAMGGGSDDAIPLDKVKQHIEEHIKEIHNEMNQEGE